MSGERMAFAAAADLLCYAFLRELKNERHFTSG